MSDRLSIIDDMSNPRVLARAISCLQSCRGIWRLDLCRYRLRRSDRQNRWYWPCFVAPFAQWLREEGNDHADDDVAHEALKAQFLVVYEECKRSGLRLARVRSTTELTTGEFNLYLDNCALMLARDCNIVVPEPNIYREKGESNEVSTQDRKGSRRGFVAQGG